MVRGRKSVRIFFPFRIQEILSLGKCTKSIPKNPNSLRSNRWIFENNVHFPGQRISKAPAKEKIF